MNFVNILLNYVIIATHFYKMRGIRVMIRALFAPLTIALLIIAMGGGRTKS